MNSRSKLKRMGCLTRVCIEHSENPIKLNKSRGVHIVCNKDSSIAHVAESCFPSANWIGSLGIADQFLSLSARSNLMSRNTLQPIALSTMASGTFKHVLNV